MPRRSRRFLSFTRVDAPVQPLVRGDIDAAVLRSPVPQELLDKPRTIELFEEPRVLVCSLAPAGLTRVSSLYH
jgi:DNA-binding transcriptional LysR family regulator